jgi:hypothetical protein
MKLISHAVHKIVIFLSHRLPVISDNISPSTIVGTMTIGRACTKNIKSDYP